MNQINKTFTVVSCGSGIWTYTTLLLAVQEINNLNQLDRMDMNLSTGTFIYSEAHIKP